MDHDRLFKQLLTTSMNSAKKLFLPDVSAYLERESIHFLDKEVFTDLTGGERHEVDLIAQAKFRGREPGPPRVRLSPPDVPLFRSPP